MVIELFNKYQVAREQNTCTFLYPADWNVNLIEDNSMMELYVLGPICENEEFRIAFRIMFFLEAISNIQDAAASFLNTFKSSFEIMTIHQNFGKLNSFDAIDIEISYSLPSIFSNNPLHSILIRDRRVFLQQNDFHCQFAYRAPHDVFPLWLDTFRILILSFKRYNENLSGDFQSILSETMQDSENSREKMGLG